MSGKKEKDFKYLSLFFHSFWRKVTLIMVGLDNAGKTATVRGIQGGKQSIYHLKVMFK